jgi:hypothetical protein
MPSFNIKGLQFNLQITKELFFRTQYNINKYLSREVSKVEVAQETVNGQSILKCINGDEMTLIL